MPFSLEMLLDYFAVYNVRVWPMQLLGYVAGLLILVPLFRRGKVGSRIVTGVLALMWLWVGLVFWVPAAEQMAMLYAPAALFAVQAGQRGEVFAHCGKTEGEAAREALVQDQEVGNGPRIHASGIEPAIGALRRQ